jgi:D-xylose transport system substrate-binding protein
MRQYFIGFLVLSALSVFGCDKKAAPEGGAAATANQAASAAPDESSKTIKIGLSLDTLKEERWQRDRDLLKASIEKQNGTLLVQSASGDDNLQNAQAENLLTQGVKVLVVVARNAKSAATIVQSAHKAGVKVISYDRLILDSDVDLYVSFDNIKVGEMQADYLVKKAPKGNYVMIAGAPTDNNAHMFRQGQLNILKPYMDKGDIKIVAEQWANNWQPVEALKIMENALTKNNNKVAAVVASNDGLAGAAIQSLGEQKLAGKVPVSGQDAELSACQRIAAGTQSMTVYKPIAVLANKVGELAMKLARNEAINEPTTKINNGKIDVPSILMAPISVDKDNLDSTVIADGFHKREDVYKK